MELLLEKLITVYLIVFLRDSWKLKQKTIAHWRKPRANNKQSDRRASKYVNHELLSEDLMVVFWKKFLIIAHSA